MANLEEEYRSLLRWYPRAWREANEAVMLGTLLDAAHAAGLTHPSRGDRRGLQLAGLRQHAIGPGQRSLVGTTSLAAGVAFSAFYCLVIGWDPRHSFDGYIGPLTNPSFITGVFLIAALVLSICKVTSAARMLAVLSIGSTIVIGLLAWRLSWLGPSLPAVVVFGAFGLCGLSRSDKISRGLMLVAASVCASVATVSLETMWLQSKYGSSPFWQIDTAIAVAAVVTSALFAWPWRSKTRALRTH
jgi:hypothetical protein